MRYDTGKYMHVDIVNNRSNWLKDTATVRHKMRTPLITHQLKQIQKWEFSFHGSSYTTCTKIKIKKKLVTPIQYWVLKFQFFFSSLQEDIKLSAGKAEYNFLIGFFFFSMLFLINVLLVFVTTIEKGSKTDSLLWWWHLLTNVQCR